MPERGDALACLRYLGTVKISNNDRSMNAAFGNDLAPGRNDETVSIGFPATFVLTSLRRGQHKTTILNGARADQHAPMRLAGGSGKSGRNGQKIGTRLSKGAIELRKAQVVTNRQSQHPPWELGQHALAASLIVLRLPIGLPIWKRNVEHVNLVEACDDVSVWRKQEGAVGNLVVSKQDRH